ncbi:A24 family peptidase [Azotobacter chroococcum]|uniref:A24 family peptidase n=1 Tax=Azotobacter chroococcum TaxID=353 RepID=UPI000B791230|nr:prepilin peptidase [Azotobacter chroococcum]
MAIVIVLSAFLLGSVIYDFISHRLPNFYLLLGLLVALILQAWLGGWAGIISGGTGFLAAFLLFIPFYALGGMAAGDVKLMAVVGSFLGASGALEAGACTLLAGGVFGILYLICRGQFGRFLSRYWAMASLRTYIPAQENDSARHRFPYAIAIFTGTLISLFWQPFGP